MSGGAVVAIVVMLFFVIGITVGFITVVALSALRREQRGQRRLISPRYGPDVLDEPGNDIDDQDPGVSGVPGHWDVSAKDNNTPTEGPATANNQPWWHDDSENSSLS